MADATVMRLGGMETFYDGLVTRVRAFLGVTSWGMQVFELPPGFGEYPNHHHGDGSPDPGQEEVYIPLRGSATPLPFSIFRPASGRCSSFAMSSAGRRERWRSSSARASPA